MSAFEWQGGRRTLSLALLVFACILLAGLSLRVITVVETEVQAPFSADSGQYFAYAYNLRHHGSYSGDRHGVGGTVAPAPDHYRNPGYSLLLLPFAASMPNPQSLLGATLMQAALSTLVILLIYLAARPLMPALAALGVALLTAISPHLINANVYILSETAASFTTVLFMLMLYRLYRAAGHRAVAVSPRASIH